MKTDNTEDQRNPSARDYEESFNKSLNTPNTPADLAAQDQRDAAMRNAGASSSVANAEKQAIGDTAVGKTAIATASATGGAVGSAAAKILGKIKTKKGGAVTTVIVLIVGAIIALAMIAPVAMLLNLKENGGKWMTRMTNTAMHKRVRDVMEKRYFADPASCKGVAIKCRFTPGLNDTEIKKLVDGGLIKEGDVATGKNGKKFLSQMTFVDKTGKTTIVTKENFSSFHASNLDFSSRLGSVVDARSILTRGKGALKKMSHFGVERSKPLGDGGDEKSRLQKFRENMYGKKGSLSASVDESTMTPEEKAKLAEVMDGLQEKADALSKDAITKGPGTLVPDTGVLDAVNPSKIVFTGIKDTLEGAFKGIFNGVDAACNMYNTIRIVNFAVKAYAAAALIKYAALFVTIADKQKDGKVATAEMSLLAGALLRPSTMPDSKGKDFSQSEGAKLMFSGKITQPSALARYSSGTTGNQALQSVFGFISAYGVSAKVCSKVLSWWGQLLIAGLGIVTGIASGGLGAVTGASIGIAKSLALSYVGQILVPKLVPIIAGTVAPDLATDPEGGYGAGNAIANGLGAFGGELGKATGMRPLTDSQLVALADSNTAKQVAALDTYNQSHRGIFDSDNPQSIQNSLAVAFTPVLSQPVSASDFFSSITNTLASAFSSPFQVAYAADQSVLSSYGGKYCEEKSNPLITDSPAVRGLARDANCNLIYGADTKTLPNDCSTDTLTVTEANKFCITPVVDYMLTNGYITEDGTPTAKGAEGDNTTSYQKFVESCVDGTDPIVDEYSADLQDSQNPALCFSDAEYVDFYRTYTQYIGGSGGVQDAADNKLGYADQSTAAGVAPATTQPNTNAPVSGEWKMPLATNFVSSEWGRRTGFGVHKGTDFRAKAGTKVFAVHSGTVSTNPELTKVSPECARFVTIEVDGYPGLFVNYQHLDKNFPAPSGRVAVGQQIGVTAPASQLARTCASGPHLHLQFQYFGNFIIGPKNPNISATRNSREFLPAAGYAN